MDVIRDPGDPIGTNWITNLAELKKLEPFANDTGFQEKWRAIKFRNKEYCAEKLKRWENVTIDPSSIFDVHVKRIHEYKRQLLNILMCIADYNDIRNGLLSTNIQPRTVIFGGKAAPAYKMAKLIIELINRVGKVINNDPVVKDYLTIQFIPNYSVSLAEIIIPASDISQQISTAGTEASGTGNMKFAINGAITIGTMDGANIEIREEVGPENIFIFGLRSDEINTLKESGMYNPVSYYERSKRLKEAIDLITSGHFYKNDTDRFGPITNSLLKDGDPFMICADFDSYYECHSKVLAQYQKKDIWTRMSILNVARIGKFSSDRTIKEYADKIWDIKPIKIS
jgi:starch phosphorylase